MKLFSVLLKRVFPQYSTKVHLEKQPLPDFLAKLFPYLENNGLAVTHIHISKELVQLLMTYPGFESVEKDGKIWMAKIHYREGDKVTICSDPEFYGVKEAVFQR